MSDINVDMNIADAVAKTAILLNLTDANRKALEEYTKATVNYNKTADKQLVTITSQIDAQRELTATYKITANGLELVRGKLNQIKKEVDDTKMNPFADSLGRIQSTLTNLALYRGFNILTHSIQEAIVQGREFEKQVALIQTISQDADTTTSQWGQSLRRVSNDLGINSLEVAKAAYSAVSNQIAKGQGVEGFLKSAGELARTTGSKIGDTTEVLSSVLNTYELGADKAEETSAKLFKTIDIGVVSMNELQGTIGRVSFLARGLGVPLEEVLALLSTLTRNGVKTSDAMTLIANGLTKLTKPTKEFKAFLESIGAPTGALAIQANTLFGVFEKIAAAAKNGQIDLAEISPEIRGEKFLNAISTFNGQYQKDLEKIKDSTNGAYEAAKKIVSSTDADAIDKFGTALRNAFSETLGNSINHAGVEIIKFLGGVDSVKAAVDGVDGTAKNLAKTIVAIAGAVAAYTVAVKGATAASFLLTRINPLAAIGAAAAGYLTYKYITADDFDKASHAADEYFARLSNQQATNNLEKQVAAVEQIKENFGKAGQEFQKRLAEAYIANDSKLDATNAKLKETQDALKSAFVGVFDLSKSKVHDLEADLGRIKTAAEALRKSQSNKTYDDRAHDSLVSTANKFANPYQQLEILQGEFKRTQSRISQLIKDGTPEAIAEADKLYDHLIKISQGWFEKDAEIRKNAFDQDLQERQKRGEVIRPGIDNIFTYDITNQARELLGIEQQQQETRTQSLAILQKQKEVKEAEIAAEKSRLNLQKKSITDFEDFNLTDASGKVKSQYLDKQGKLDIEKARKDLGDKARALRGSTDDDINKRIGIDSLIATRGDLLEKQLLEVKTRDELNKAAGGLNQGREAADKKLGEGKKFITAYGEEIKVLTSEVTALAEALKGLSASGPEKVLRAALADKKLFGFDADAPVGQDVLKIFGKVANINGQSKLKQVQDLFDPLNQKGAGIAEKLQGLSKQTIKVGGQDVVDPKAVRDIVLELQQYKELLNNTIPKAAEKFGVNFDTTELKKFGDEIDDVLKRLSGSTAKLGYGGQQVDIAKTQIQALTDEMKDALKTFEGMNTALISVVGGVGAAADRSRQDIDKLILKAEEAAEKMKALSPGGGQGKFYGGPIYRAYGGPVGQDTIPLWGAEGEYMMNAASTRRYYSQIQSMNHTARVPQYFSGGGEVTNMGGITFNITESASPQTTAREVNRLLRRANRQGSI